MHAATAFGLGLATLALFAWGVLGQDDREQICAPGYAKAHRMDEQTRKYVKREAAIRAGIPLYQAHNFELDHIVPLELAGSNGMDNLQMQPCSKWERTFHGIEICVEGPAANKDRREHQAHWDYCHGKIALPEAQAQFKREWP